MSILGAEQEADLPLILRTVNHELTFQLYLTYGKNWLSILILTPKKDNSVNIMIVNHKLGID